jgi:DNA-binding response OmpR family regulator
LVVEDHPDLRAALCMALESLGYHTRQAADAMAALTQILEATPDLVCMDLVLPESSGYALCQLIRETPALRHMPVVMLCERRNPADRAIATEAGADAFLSKPISLAELIRCVQQLLQSASP